MDTTSTKMAVFGLVMHVLSAGGNVHKLTQKQDSITTQRLLLSLLFSGLYLQIIARNTRQRAVDKKGIVW